MIINKIGFTNNYKHVKFGQNDDYMDHKYRDNENWEEDNLHNLLRNHIFAMAGGFQLMTNQPHKISAENLPEDELNKLNFDYNYIKNLRIPNFTILTNRKGVRGSSLLESKNKEFLPYLRQAGIKQIIDLREKKSNQKEEENRNLCNENGLEYFHFPVSYDNSLSEENFKLISQLSDLIEKGNFYIACNEGINRTDMVVALNYLLSPKQTTTPHLKSYSPLTIIHTVQKEINNKILNKETTPTRQDLENYIKSLGWSDYETFKEKYKSKLTSLTGHNRS